MPLSEVKSNDIFLFSDFTEAAEKVCPEIAYSCDSSFENASFFINPDCYVANMCACFFKSSINFDLYQVDPFLYPFSIEFHILMAKYPY